MINNSDEKNKEHYIRKYTKDNHKNEMHLLGAVKQLNKWRCLVK